MSYFVSMSVKYHGICTQEYVKHRSVVFTTPVHRHNLAGQRGGTWLCSVFIPKGWFTHSVPCPCRTQDIPVPYCASKSSDCVFPIWFTECGCVWFALAMPCPCHALTMLFFSRPQHSTSIERRTVGYLPAFSFFQLPCGVPQRLLSEAYQSQMQVASVKPNNICHGRGKEW